ncbi:MAG: TVP38/TMEM64 family protein [Phycisphaerales bacterium]|nr:TVP38/TMEM64 family protein [Phycisphaerales bacterium]
MPNEDRKPDGTPSDVTPDSAAKVPGVAPAASAGDIARRLGPVAFLGVWSAFIPALGSIFLFRYMDSLGAWLHSHESLGVVFYAVGFAILAGLALLPTYASAILGGWAFGMILGYPAALVGFLGGSLIGYAVAKPTAGERVIKLIDERPKWKVVRKALLESGFARMLLIITLLRLPPNSPFAITNLVLASVRVPLGVYVLGTLLGMAPRTGIVLYIATQISQKFSEHAKDAAKADKPWWFIVAGVVLSIVALVVIGFIANRALEKVTSEHKGVGIEAED